jgi:hypothetical protein
MAGYGVQQGRATVMTNPNLMGLWVCPECEIELIEPGVCEECDIECVADHRSYSERKLDSQADEMEYGECWV